MKTKLLVAVAVLFAVGRLLGETPKDPANVVPSAFELRDAAAKYTSELFAGGAVESLKVGKEEVLVLIVYGSGVPDIAIAAYRFDGKSWLLVAKWQPPTVEIHEVVAIGNEIVIVGARTGQKWILYAATNERANQTAEPASPSRGGSS